MFEIELKVRDYECDIQGIVNNSVYQNYLEHTRHEFLEFHRVSFADLHNKGVDAVVARLEMAFKSPLKPGDSFVSKLKVSKEGVKYVFHQTIHRKSDYKLSIRAKVETVVVIDGQLAPGVPELDALVGI